MQKKPPPVEQDLMKELDSLIDSIKRTKELNREEDIATLLGYNEGYFSQVRSRGKVSDKLINRMKDFLAGLQKANLPTPDTATLTEPEVEYSQQPIIQVVLNLTYIGKKNADSMDRMTISMDKMADSNLQNSKSIATLVNLIATNSDLASLLASPQEGQHKGDGLPAEAFLGGHPVTGKKKQVASKG